MGLDRSQFLAHADVPTKVVDVPEWGDGAQVTVRCLSSKARFSWGLASQKAAAGEPAPDPTAMLLTLGVVGDDGQPLFTVQDSDAISDLRGDVVERLASAVLDVSGMGAVAAVDAEKNSETTPSDGSSSSSPETSDAPSLHSATV